MNPTMRPKAHLILAAFLAGIALQGRGDDPTLESLKQIYTAEVQKLKDEHAWVLRSRLQDYADALDNAVEALKQAGDPAPVLQAKNEQQRFAFERTVPYPPATEGPAAVASLQVQYHKAVGDAEVAKGKTFSDLSRNYMAALERLTKSLTAQDKLDLAMDVKSEQRRVEANLADVEVQHARLVTQIARLDMNITLPLSLKRGLVLHYGFDMDERSKVTDKSGIGNPGLVHGAGWTRDGQRGAGFYLDGNSWIEVPHSQTLPLSTMTFAAWVRLKRWDKASGPICAKGTGNGGEAWLLDAYVHDAFRFVRRRSSQEFIAAQAPPLPVVDVLHHLTAVDTGSSITLYVDARPVASQKSSWARMANTHCLSLGARQSDSNTGYDLHMAGLMDEVMIWNRALSDDEVKQVYQLTGGK